MMASTPGAFRTSPDPAVVDELIGEGLDATEDPGSQAWLLVVRGMSARLWRGSEPFGQGTIPDPLPIAERIAGVEQAVAVGRAQGLPDLLVAADDALILLYSLARRYRDALALTRTALTRVESTKSSLEQADVLRRAAVHSIMIEASFAEALPVARRCHALSAGANPHQVMHCTWPLLVALYQLGRWLELPDVVAEHVAALAEDPALDCHFVRDGPLIGATVLAHCGDLAGAQALAALAGDALADPQSATAWQARFATASGDPQRARQISTGKAGEGRLYGPQHALCLLDALVQLEDFPGVSAFLPTARANVAGNALLGPYCERAEGILHARSDPPREAAAAMRRALAGFAQLKVPFEAALTREHLAALESGAAARAQLQTALVAFERLGATPHRDRVWSLLQLG